MVVQSTKQMRVYVCVGSVCLRNILKRSCPDLEHHSLRTVPSYGRAGAGGASEGRTAHGTDDGRGAFFVRFHRGRRCEVGGQSEHMGRVDGGLCPRAGS